MKIEVEVPEGVTVFGAIRAAEEAVDKLKPKEKTLGDVARDTYWSASPETPGLWGNVADAVVAEHERRRRGTQTIEQALRNLGGVAIQRTGGQELCVALSRPVWLALRDEATSQAKRICFQRTDAYGGEHWIEVGGVRVTSL